MKDVLEEILAHKKMEIATLDPHAPRRRAESEAERFSLGNSAPMTFPPKTDR